MSYNTVAESEQYLNTHFLSTDDAFVFWADLTDEDKQVLLEKAHDIIDALPLVGRKTSVTQLDAFPRYPAKEVPLEVKAAECELAIALSDTESNENFKNYQKMVDYGIQSYHIGSFGETLLSYSKNSPAIAYGLISDTAKQLLTPWTTGGYRIG